MSKKKHLKILAVLFAMALALCMMPMTTYAATKAVTVSAKSQSMYVGTKNKSLGVEVTEGAKVTYKSSSPSVVAVSSSGKVTAKKAGSVKITIKASKKGYKTTSKVITVKAVRRKNSITASSKTVYLGKMVSVGAKAKTALTYKSSNTGIVTVDSKGILRGKKAGTATITITAKSSTIYGSATKKITVTVKKAPVKKNQSITASNKSVYVGKTVSIGAKAKTALTYKSSDTGVVTVDSKGTLKGKKAGTATITITAKASTTYNSATKKITVTVKKAPAKKNQSITASDKSVYVYDTASIAAKAQTTLTYKSSNTEIVEVDSEGILKGKKAGTATITITAKASTTYNSATKKITVTVTKQPNVISVEDANGFVFKVGDIWIPNLTCVDGTTDNMIFEISDPSVVGIEGDGYFVGYKAGTAVITVTAPETAQCTSTTIKFTVTVVKEEQEPKKSNDIWYSFNDESTWHAGRYMNWIMKKGTVVKLNAACENNSDVNWAIEGPANIATIDSAGNIRGLGRGVVRVTMWVDETDEYYSGSIQFWLRVVEPGEDTSSYEGDWITGEETSTLLNAPCESDSAMTFESDNSSAATGDVNGDVTITEEQESSEIFNTEVADEIFMPDDCGNAMQEEYASEIFTFSEEPTVVFSDAIISE